MNNLEPNHPLSCSTTKLKFLLGNFCIVDVGAAFSKMSVSCIPVGFCSNLWLPGITCGTWRQWDVRHKLKLIINLLVVQIRKSVRKKHTLPAYKLRYQPFFTTPSTTHGQAAATVPRDILVSGQKLNVGQLRVNVLNCTRLIQLSADDATVYCTVSIGNFIAFCLHVLACSFLQY